jgi:pyridoxal phosphate enzyme (YggS family)
MESKAIRIKDTVAEILDALPPGVTLVAAAKGRSIAEVELAIEAGVTHVGQNYVQEAKPMFQALGERANWHMIGHLQRNKVPAAVKIFNMIETIDSVKLAETIESRCARLGLTLPVLIEINSGRELNKTGVLPEKVDELVEAIAGMQHVRLMGLMTMGPRFGDPEDARPYFQATRETFDRLSSRDYSNVTMRYLSMGMTNSYQVALEEGANIIRIGTKIFGAS